MVSASLFLASVYSPTVQTLHQSIPEELWPPSLRQRLISARVLSARISFPCRLGSSRSSSCPLRMTAESGENQPKGLVEEMKHRHEYSGWFFFLFSHLADDVTEEGENKLWSGLCNTHTHCSDHLQCYSALHLNSGWLKKTRRPCASSQTAFISICMCVPLCVVVHIAWYNCWERSWKRWTELRAFLSPASESVGLGSLCIILTFLMLFFSKVASAPVQGFTITNQTTNKPKNTNTYINEFKLNGYHLILLPWDNVLLSMLQCIWNFTFFKQ